MAPQRDQRAAAEAAPAPSQASGAPLPDAEDPQARAPLRWPYTSRAQQERAQLAAAAREESGSEIESSEASDGERWHSDARRVHAEDDVSDEEISSLDSPHAAAQEDEPAENEPDEPAAELSDDALAARRAQMFVSSAASPTVSGLPPLAAVVTKGLVKLAAADVNALEKATIDALSAAFGNFDRVVALGWLIADAVRPVGLPAISRADAYAVGIKARREAGNIRTDEAADKKAASRLPGGDRKREDIADAAAQRLQEPVELPLPAVEPAAASSQRPTSGSRKRARQQQEEEPSHEQVIAFIAAEELEAERAIKKAEAKVARAEAKADGKAKVAVRMTRKIVTCMKPDKYFTFEPLREAAVAAWNEAVADEKDAQIELLEARLGASELENARLGLEWEHAREEWGESIEREASWRKDARVLAECCQRLSGNA